MISLIITCQGRNYHLQRLLEGVSRNTTHPDEIIIVSNDARIEDLPSELNIKIVPSPFDGFPIGKNRNYGAKNATHEDLFFLDVDCIPDINYFEKLYADYMQFGGLCMGNPHYLKHKVPANFSFETLRKDAIAHPHRPDVSATRPEEDYAMFWSLCFALSRNDFKSIGGFDTQFVGYGAEDTDFGFMARKHHISFTQSDSIAYHQQHPIYRPPVNHIKDIVHNSNVFYHKWGVWPMAGWLQTFKENGWIDWSEDRNTDIEILQLPDSKTIDTYKVEHGRFV